MTDRRDKRDTRRCRPDDRRRGQRGARRGTSGAARMSWDVPNTGNSTLCRRRLECDARGRGTSFNVTAVNAVKGPCSTAIRLIAERHTIIKIGNCTSTLSSSLSRHGFVATQLVSASHIGLDRLSVVDRAGVSRLRRHVAC